MNIQFTPVIEENYKPIVPLRKFTQRREKRGYEKEAKKVEKYLVSIESEFEFSIFEAPKGISYQAIYEYFLDLWQEAVKKILLIHDFKYIAIDVHYFSKNYKPRP